MAEFLDYLRDTERQKREQRQRALMETPLSQLNRPQVAPHVPAPTDPVAQLIDQFKLNSMIGSSMSPEQVPAATAPSLAPPALPRMKPQQAPVAAQRPPRAAPGVMDPFMSVKEIDITRPVDSLGDYTPYEIRNYLIPQESSNNPRAVSPKGATGLMQLIPSTAKEQAELMGLPWLGTEALKSNPEYNIKLGTGYLNRQLRSFGDARLGLAAYNWGPGNLTDLIKRLGTDDIHHLWKHLPKETKQYINKIIGGVNSVRRSKAPEG